MFTGIVTDLGAVKHIERKQGTRFFFSTSYPTGDIPFGASIACNGCCLTLVDKGDGWFAADVSPETLAVTTLGEWMPGTPVNLERAMRMGDEFGGHIVSGHVDGVATVTNLLPDHDAARIVFKIEQQLSRFVAVKGSVTVDGVSLTVNAVSEACFEVSVIPHTRKVTTLGGAGIGTKHNFEIDLLARYVDRLTGSGLA
ncbi:riboflavin synthase [Haematospirillum jordaniae]|uniref:Riboflavin synthase n=1 Tax=Haematospirillum jordaniae TaxID=1549855 RepID=A0A143DFT6_9PROT|nr:riboflavin synthase [Haematospirillum jordaniae]AMW35153.1 riboflavin synthase subunit alpha [Haematospirillum jordaniae]NKD46082.1 riboflavin synthase [Haematospirillum jordaniae]NKD56460.1 riboflavin synthase [Haematospirillum jordaniae]NKD58518.1 riboflavin synthase [Haematospirillum jordaniae]NKD66313.1 riboflavin synthase [Haematospirillum jordaniae]